ncbi:MAG: NAD(P)H-binding protein, partial [Gemmatimonadales bacterium]
MHVFLTGASGYIGGAVADRLRAAGHDVSGLARSDAASARLTAAGIRPLRGDFSSPASLATAARSADGVISMATTYDASIDGPAIDAILD